MSLIALTFLTPLAGVIAAGVALPVLLALYFLKLRRRTVRISTVLLWSQAVQDLQVNAPFRMIRPSWLLLLHLLILACFVFAIARPAIDAPAAAGQRVILVIDRSASMSAGDGAEGGMGDTTRLDAAKQRANELVGRLLGVGGGRTRIMLVAFADQAQTLVNYTRDAGQLRDAINTIQPTDQPARLDAALKVVEAFAAPGDEGDAPDPPRVILLSDGAFEQRGAAAPLGLDRVGFQFVRVGPEAQAPRDNIGIVALSARRDYDEPAVVRIFVRLLSTNTEPVTMALRCELDTEVVASAAVTVPGATDTTAGIGEVTHSFELNNDSGGVVRVVIPRADALASDNAAALVLPPLRGLRITVVRPAGAMTTAEAQLARALQSLDPIELRLLSTSDLPADPATRWSLPGTDLVVFDRVRPEALPSAPSLSFGATVPLPGLAIDIDAPRRSSGFTYWVRTHPVMRYVSLGSVVLDRPMVLTAPESGPENTAAARFSELASGSGGPLVVLAEQGLMRRLVVGVDLAETNWWRDPSFPVFIANAADYLTLRGEQASGLAVTTTQPVSLPVPGAVTEATLDGPGGFERTATRGADGAASFGTLPLAGLYRLREARDDPAGVLAVNLMDEHESRIGSSQSVRIAGESVSAAGIGGLVPREIWEWFVLAGVVLLAVEWALFAWRMRV